MNDFADAVKEAQFAEQYGGHTFTQEEVSLQIGITRRHMGDLDGAMTDFAVAGEDTQHNGTPWLLRALTSRQKGDLPAALMDFDKCLEENGDDAVALLFRGLTKRTLGDEDGALQDFAAATSIDAGLAQRFYSQEDAVTIRQQLLQMESLPLAPWGSKSKFTLSDT